jgi:hypothetical protein
MLQVFNLFPSERERERECVCVCVFVECCTAAVAVYLLPCKPIFETGRKQFWRQLGGGVSRCSNLVTESESRATVGAGEGGRGGREPGGGSCRVELAGGRAVFSRDLNTSTTCLRFRAGEDCHNTEKKESELAFCYA